MPRIVIREGSPKYVRLGKKKLPKKGGFIRKHSRKRGSKR